VVYIHGELKGPTEESLIRYTHAGGHKWIEPATLDLVNLAPDHFITTHRVTSSYLTWSHACGSCLTRKAPQARTNAVSQPLSIVTM